MFGWSEFKQTRVYQEAKEEGKLETIPLFLQLGLTVEQYEPGSTKVLTTNPEALKCLLRTRKH